MSSLRLFRESRGLSQRALARRAGVAFRTLQMMESGRHNPRWSTVSKLARALRVDGADLVKESQQTNRAEATLRECSFRIVRDGSKSWKGHLMEFVDAFRRNPGLDQVAEAPTANLAAEIMALLGATAEVLCGEAGIPSPWWTMAVPVPREPWFVADSESLKASALVESPAQFRQRNIFVLDNFLERA